LRNRLNYAVEWTAMHPPHRPRETTDYASWDCLVTDDGSRTLVDRSLGESFHSGSGAVAETLWVYLRNSGALDRLRQGQSTRIFEVGLGAGIALVMTAAAAESWNGPLLYAAIDRQLPPWDLIERLNPASAIDSLMHQGRTAELMLPAHYPETVSRTHAELVRAIRQYQQNTGAADYIQSSPPVPGGIAKQQKLGASANGYGSPPMPIPSTTAPANLHEISFHLGANTKVHLFIGDATALAADERFTSQAFDCIYFDPFSPDTTPGLWEPPIFARMRSMLKPSGVLTTYCVRRSVRRCMQQAGLRPEVVPGPPAGKREVLRAWADV
ncbi:MAG: hypothetical protein D6753_08195, partial [Planctomycetota bacterium]